MFIKLFDAVKPTIVSDEFHLVLEEDMITVDGISASRTELVSLKISSKFFEGYDVHEKKILPLPFDNFMDQIKMFKTFKLMTIEYDEENNRVHLYAKDGRKRKNNYIQTISTLREYSDPNTIKVPYNVMFSIDIKDFDKQLNECEYFNPLEVDMKLTDTEFVISAGDDAKTGGTEQAWTLGQDIEALMADPMEIQFTTTLLTAITGKIKSIADKVTVSMFPQAPIKMSLTFPNGSLVYYIVPNDEKEG